MSQFFIDKAHLESIAEYDVPAGVIASNNDMQCKAIEKALTSTFSLIHGPPGNVSLII